MDRIPVHVCARDPVSRAGVASQLRPRPEVLVVDSDGEPDGSAALAVVVADAVDDETVRLLRRAQRAGCRAVLVTTHVDDAGLAAAIEAGVAALVRREEATPERLARAVCAAARGEGTVPPDLLGRLLDHVGRLQRQVLERLNDGSRRDATSTGTPAAASSRSAAASAGVSTTTSKSSTTAATPAPSAAASRAASRAGSASSWSRRHHATAGPGGAGVVREQRGRPRPGGRAACGAGQRPAARLP